MQAEVELLTALIPKPGYSLEALCGTSYGMSPRILLAIVGFTSESIDADLDISSLEGAGRGRLISSLEENLKKVLFVRERGLNLEGNRDNWDAIEILLADQTVSKWKRDKNMGSQHAKFILATFTNKVGGRYGRLYIGSKNFTSGLSKELGVVLELSENKSASAHPFQRQLISFLQNCVEPELVGANNNKTIVYDKLLRALKKSNLAPISPTIEMLFQSRHKKNNALWTKLIKEIETSKRTDIHSPWADPNIVKELISKNDKMRLHVKCLKDTRFRYTSLPRTFIHFDGISAEGKLHGHQSHAKAYLFTKQKNSVLYFGSANMTASGLGLSKTPNTEILLKWPSANNEFKSLLCEGEGLIVDDADVIPLTPSEQDKIQQGLFSIEVNLEYSEAKRSLIYRLNNVPNRKVEIKHLLLEPLGNGSQGAIEIKLSKEEEQEISVEIAESDLKKISSWIVLTTTFNGQSIEADLNVDLPPAFYNARSDLKTLKAFRLIGDQIIQELLNLADFSVSTGTNGIGNRDTSDLQMWTQWLGRVHLERLALRLYKMKYNDPVLFEQRIRRLDRVIVDLEKSEIEEFEKLARTLREVSSVVSP